MKWQLHHIFLCLLLATTTFALPSYTAGDRLLQVTFQAQGLLDQSFLEWELPPNPNFTHHLIFNSVSGLLQRWPNTLRRNGHNMVPATIPTGTILYHGRADNQVPDVPDWLAFDFEHSYLFCHDPCYVISLQTRRDLRLVYFDGSSAAKMPGGSLDTQDIVAWGELRQDKLLLERERINTLCDWGRPFGLDGFVRMEFHFEVMICDMTDGLEVITLLDMLPKNDTGPSRRSPKDHPGDNPRLPPLPLPKFPPFPPPTGPPPNWRGSLPDGSADMFEAILAGSWHDRAPGETRVHLDLTGLVTFYDPTLSSLVEARLGKDKMHHRLKGISTTDKERVISELRTVLTRKQGGGSGVDWRSITRAVTERYAERLDYLQFLLSPNARFANAAEQAANARVQVLTMLVPYITTADVPERLPASANTSWAAPVVRRCATTQTSRIPLGMLTPQEARIHAAVENTLREICRRLVLVWLEFFDVEGADEATVEKAIEVGRGHVSELMGWLDWSVWVECKPGCGPGETCYLPSWPFLEGDDPYDMTPRCISSKDAVRP
ncbi:hypothetical protein BJV78DRAFT_125115 [Lactifluus subvellereus]|nr:hypothetical protein BJV78DRAFT_125115 [Lactifluus subvellereus]